MCVSFVVKENIMNRWLIKSTTRSGSHLIYNLLVSSGLKGYHVTSNDNLFDKNSLWLDQIIIDEKIIPTQSNVVLHDHTSWLPEDTKKWNLVYTKRKDQIAQTISSYFAGAVNEYVLEGNRKYTNKKIEPFSISPGKILSHHKKRLAYENKLNSLVVNNKWKTNTTYYYEDLVKLSPDKVANFLNIKYDKRICNWEEQKNPRVIKDYIKNYDKINMLLRQSFG